MSIKINMAGTFTHLMICQKAKSTQTSSALDDELWRLLNKHSQFLYLGAVSPDLPYLSFKTGKINWADVMHYENTNGIAISGHADLTKINPIKNETDEVKLIWLLGYISHLVIDATIHPIVQAIVGPYSDPPNREPHRICEMTQDSLIFNEMEKGDIKYSDFVEIIKFCKESPHFNDLMAFWMQQLQINYSGKNEKPDPPLWFSTYAKAIDLADGDSSLAAIFRHIGIVKNYIYETKEQIMTGLFGRYEQYYSQIELPSKKTGEFFKDGFERATGNVQEVWNKLYMGLTGVIVVTDIIKNWNLDTGVDQDSPEDTVTYFA
jgi:hypothetical protein